MKDARGRDTGAVAAAIVAVVVWSSAFAGISQVVTRGGYGAGEAVLLRFLVASASMAVVALAVRMRLPKWRDLPRLAAAALLGITFYHLAFTFGETRVSAGAAALIIASGPIWTALFAVAFLRERFNGWGWAGVVLAFCGVGSIAFGEGGGLTLEPMALLELVAALSTAAYFVVGKKPLRTYTALEFTAYTMWLGTIPLLLFAPGLLRQAPLAPAWSTWTVVFLGVFPGAIAYLLWSYALARMPASTTSSFLYGQPVLAALVAWAWQGVVPAPLTMAGGALALAGVVLVQTRGRPKPVVEVGVATGDADREAVRVLAGELLDHFAAAFGVHDPDRRTEEFAAFDAAYAAPVGAALLASVDGYPAGCAVVRDLGSGVAELRRVYVRPAYRRRGLARELVRVATAEAARLGYRRLQFMTSERMEGAIELYASEGFEPMRQYRETHMQVVAFGRDL